jgi:hypothetical protein
MRVSLLDVLEDTGELAICYWVYHNPSHPAAKSVEGDDRADLAVFGGVKITSARILLTHTFFRGRFLYGGEGAIFSKDGELLLREVDVPVIGFGPPGDRRAGESRQELE